MKKFLKFCKLPLALMSVTWLVGFLVLLIVMVSIPHVSKYSYHHDLLGTNVEIEMSFKKQDFTVTSPEAQGNHFSHDKVVVMNVKMNSLASNKTEEFVFGYEIKGGHLYVINQDGVTAEIAEINAFGVEFDVDLRTLNPALFNNNTELIAMLDEIELKCTWSTALLGVSIAMVSLGGVLGLFSIAIIVLDKFGVFSKKTDQTTRETEQPKE